VRQVGGTSTLTVKANTEALIYVARNSNELQLKRADDSNTQVTVQLLIGVY